MHAPSGELVVRQRRSPAESPCAGDRLRSVVDGFLLRVNEVGAQTGAAGGEVEVDGFAVPTHSVVPPVEGVLADFDNLGFAAAGLIDDAHGVCRHGWRSQCPYPKTR